MGLTDLTVQAIIFRILALLMIAGVQGAVVAAAAVLLGDRGPRYDGRLTVMPTRHIDPLGAASMILWGYGWARPVAIDAGQFRVGRVGVLLVVLAGFVALLLLAAILAALVLPALTTLPHAAALTTAAFLRVASSLSIWFALLSLVPVPPLTGGLLLGAFGIRISRQARWVLTAALVVAVATGFVRQLLGPAHAVLASIILGR
jgi:hypothetical protein